LVTCATPLADQKHATRRFASANRIVCG
jgi:hypothetical protein